MSATSTSSTTTAIRRERGRLGHRLSGLAVALGCVLFLGGFAWAALSYRPYTVPTDSMQPTVQPGAKVLAQKISGSDVHRGDVVVFKDKLWGDLPEVKRVIGVGGDTVVCCDKQGRLQVDGRPVAEPYLKNTREPASGPFSTTVPKGKLFLLGDNRAVSQDSRIHLDDAEKGAVPASDVRGRVAATVWPLGHAGGLPSAPGFAPLPGGGQSGTGPLAWLVVMVVAGAVLILGGAVYEPLARRVARR
ncbi:signal peptidase I [Actinacidiphila guanduensis]|uniref:Signal peptidase I n=1 Tax=Actinacidiphila guanduensis TaxID=310781 RepID=A0A1H0PIC6_9ACTN|nr:signal peptidase I [Actinacidiphila guanduensis]SDP04842.1 signal peptidase I [Actinacidiphila guanduensis]